MANSGGLLLTEAATIDRVSPSAYCATRFMPWEQAAGEKPGSWLRNVVNAPSIGLRVDMRRPDPGLQQGSHGHPNSFEQLYVVGGDFKDHRHAMRAGDFVYRRPAVPHGSITRLGAEVLVVFNEADSLDTIGPDARVQHEVHVLSGTEAASPAESAQPWSAFGSANGVVRRELYRDANCGMRACILQFRCGVDGIPIGSDSEFTQLLVISGAISDGDHQMAAGDYACHAPGVAKSISSPQGAELLVMHFRNKKQRA